MTAPARESDPPSRGDAAREPGPGPSADDLTPGAAPGGNSSHQNRQAVMYCPYCAEETLFPQEHGWECRSCLRAFSVRFLGLVPAGRGAGGPGGQVRS